MYKVHGKMGSSPDSKKGVALVYKFCHVTVFIIAVNYHSLKIIVLNVVVFFSSILATDVSTLKKPANTL